MEGTEEDISRREMIYLRDKVKKLEADVAALQNSLARSYSSTREYEDVIRQQLDILHAENSDAFSRIKNIEFTVFPNLAADIVRLDSIIKGEDNQKECPFERRHPKK